MVYETVELSELEARAVAKEPRVVADHSLASHCHQCLDVPLVVQSGGPLVLSLAGLLLASFILDKAQHWPQFVQLPELLLMVPVLLNLKGNLEVSVTGRLSTQTHKQGSISAWLADSVVSNAAVLAVQSAVSGLVLGSLTAVIGAMAIHKKALLGGNVLLVLATPVVATVLSAALNYVLLVMVIGAVAHSGMDPDNVATPLAAALGDFTSVAFLCVAAVVLDGRPAACLVCLGLAVAVIVVSYVCHLRSDEAAAEVLLSGWIPIVVALLITTLAGLLLEQFYTRYPSLPVLLPVVNGITGGLVSVYACRLMTALDHGSTLPGSTPTTLLLLNLPIQALGWAFLVQGSSRSSVGEQLLVSSVHVLLMLILTKLAVRCTVGRHFDPATYCLPVVAAVSDLLGTVILIIGLVASTRASGQ